MRTTARFLAILLVLATTGAAGTAWADKLIVFKNGKAMRAKSVVKEGIWLKCEFEGNNFMSVKASLVSGIEEAAIGSNEGDLRFNKVAAGSGSYAPPRPQAYTDEGHQEAAQVQQQQSEEEAALLAAAAAEEAAARRAEGALTAVGSPRPGQRVIGTNQPVQPGGVNGLQPLNQSNTPFSSRAQQRRLSRFGVQPQQQQGNEDN